MYQKVSTDLNFEKREREVMAFWEEKNIVQKSFEHRKGAEEFTFYDGPPTANGKPHIGHVVTRAVKDLIPRYHTMKGKNVLRKAGWDTHGLPVELEVEKALGLNGKPQIEAYGIEPFIKECKKSVWKYLHEWEDMSKRVGYWVDMEHPYITYEDNYIESVWWSLKEIDKMDLLYKGHKVIPYCPRCGTALSSHEVAQGYKEVEDTSIYVAFKVKDQSNTFLLAWTTTPWTLPSNVALCVNPKEEYVYLKTQEGKTYILAKELVEKLFDKEHASYTIEKTLIGQELKGLEYEPLYTFDTPKEKAWYVVTDDYVTLTDGTGIVHTAPAFGEDDARIGHDNGLPFIQLVNDQGKFVAQTPWADQTVQEANPLIIEDLDSRDLLFKEEAYVHNYPFCWRCDTALLYYARSTWFIKMSALRDELVKNNRSVNWMPDNIKEGRMGNFLENVIDWGLSRERYWGTPLPIWVCEQGHRHVIGSKQELHELALTPFEDVELHRPFIDDIVLKCPQCSGPMHRVKEVIDAWYDSGSMPFAQWHYPFENKELFKQHFPADFISEAVDQTRGWFYTLQAISTLLFKKSPYQNCIVLGHVQDKDGIKMSKHKGNVIDPWSVLDTKGADALRWYFYSSAAPWLPSRFSIEGVEETQRKFMGTLQNTYAFFVLYANIDQFNPLNHPLEKASLSLMDQWVLSKLNTLVKQVDDDLANYRIPEPARAIEKFVDDLSNWYVRRSRERFWGKGMEGDKEAAFITLYTVLETFSRLLAPFLPFLSESIYQNLVCSVNPQAPQSVHLADFPVYDEGRINPSMEKQMDALVEVIQLGRSGRNAAAIKVRQPIGTLYIKGTHFDQNYVDLAKDELNVKEVRFTDESKDFTTYNLKPQMKTIGPRYGKLLNPIREYLAAQDGNQVVDTFLKGEALTFTINGTQVTLNQEDVLTEAISKPGFMAQSEGAITVVLDTNLTDELLQEGFAREVVSKIQTMRKDAEFEVADRIEVVVDTQSEKLHKAIDAQKDMIQKSVLALSISYGSIDQSEYSKYWDINGEAATIGIKR